MMTRSTMDVFLLLRKPVSLAAQLPRRGQFTPCPRHLGPKGDTSVNLQTNVKLPLLVVSLLLLGAFSAAAVFVNRSAYDDEKSVAALDTQYQAAVKVNDAATMDRILADDFVLVTGSGRTHNKAELLADAHSGSSVYEKNDELEQKVRVWGDTAVVTAKLWEKGKDKDKPFDHIFYFSDTYVRTPSGWRYVFGQSSLPLPQNP
jgi:ketosteroid isomerase-like protein